MDEAGLLLVVEGTMCKELQRNRAIEPCILSLVDDAHAALAELFDDPVVADGLADHDGPVLPFRG